MYHPWSYPQLYIDKLLLGHTTILPFWGYTHTIALKQLKCTQDTRFTNWSRFEVKRKRGGYHFFFFFLRMDLQNNKTRIIFVFLMNNYISTNRKLKYCFSLPIGQNKIERKYSLWNYFLVVFLFCNSVPWWFN